MNPRLCACKREHPYRRVVLTGGPGAGKTAVLELVRRSFCAHVQVLPEAASVLFGGGFPRRLDPSGLRAAQRAIYHVQSELERLYEDDRLTAVALCDRGTIDGAAYWPGTVEEFFADLRTTREREFARYAAVILLRTPAPEQGYNQANPLRVETAQEAQAIDQRLLEVWAGHPRLHVLESTVDFMEKARAAVALIEQEIPSCCATGRAAATVG